MARENKTTRTDVPVEDFLATVENKRRRADAEVALEIYREITGHEPYMAGPSIIGFDAHRYKHESGRSGMVIGAGFSPRKANMTFYLGNRFEGAAELYARLGKHKKSVACVYINKLDDVDLEVLKEIIRRQYARSKARHEELAG